MSGANGTSGSRRLSQVIHFPLQKEPHTQHVRQWQLPEIDANIPLMEVTRWVAAPQRLVAMLNPYTVVCKEADSGFTISFWQHGIDADAPTHRSILPPGVRVYDASKQGRLLLDQFPSESNPRSSTGDGTEVTLLCLVSGTVEKFAVLDPFTDVRLSCDGASLLFTHDASQRAPALPALQWYGRQEPDSNGRRLRTAWQSDSGSSRPHGMENTPLRVLQISPDGRWAAVTPGVLLPAAHRMPGDPFSALERMVYLVDRHGRSGAWHALGPLKTLSPLPLLPVAFSPDSQQFIIAAWGDHAPSNSLTVVNLAHLAQNAKDLSGAISLLKGIDSVFDDARYRAVIQLAVSPDNRSVGVLLRSGDRVRQLFYERYILEGRRQRSGHCGPIVGDPRHLCFSPDNRSALIGALDHRGNYIVYRHMTPN